MKKKPDEILEMLKQNHEEQMSKRRALVRGFLNGNPPYNKQMLEKHKADPRVQAINQRWKIAREHDEAMQKLIEPLYSKL